MQFEKTIRLRSGKTCLLRSATPQDAAAVLENFNLTHGETDFLLTYPEESSFTVQQEAAFLQKKLESDREVEIAAIVDGRVVGTAGIDEIGGKEKVRHRAEFGISMERASWGLGIGRALLEASIECARKAGYTQIELTVVEENTRAVEMYRRAGFVQYGRNPKGFHSRICGDQPILLMALEL